MTMKLEAVQLFKKVGHFKGFMEIFEVLNRIPIAVMHDSFYHTIPFHLKV